MPSVLCVPPAPIPLQIQVMQPPKSTLQACVIVPVRNEAETLPAALEALARQRDAQNLPLDPVSYEVLVLANNCTDASADIVRQFAQQHPHFILHLVEVSLPPSLAHIGVARRLAMDEACRRLLLCRRPCGVIASTDGDSEVAPDWLFQTLKEFAQGADAVGGCIRTRQAVHPDPEARRYAQRDRIYQQGLARLEAYIDPNPVDFWPRHSHFFGGSLAVTAEVYCRTGGLPVVPCLEDVALERALGRIDASVRHSPAVRVCSSARQIGRVAQGLATQLQQWSEMGRAGQPHFVQQPEAVEIRLQARKTLRHWWRAAAAGCSPSGEQVEELAEVLAISSSLILRELGRTHQPFGILWSQILDQHEAPYGCWAQRWPLCEISRALTDLKARLTLSRRMAQ